MAYPRILYLNRTLAATVTASATTSGYPVANLGDMRNYLRWHGSGATNSYTISIDLGSALSVTSLALSGHNLYTVGARYKLEAGDNGVDYGTSVLAYTTPGNNKTVAHFFTDPSKRYYRLTIDNNGGANFTPQLGVLFLGDYLEFPDWIDSPFDPDAEIVHGSQQLGETGNLLGRATDWRERNITMNVKYLTRAWITATWQPYWNSYFDQPFIFVWDATDHATEAYLMAWNMDRMSAPYDANSAYRPLALAMIGKVES